MYVFVCIVLEEVIFLCWFMCNEVRNGCELLMNKFGFEWLDSLKCEKFFEFGMCVGENRIDFVDFIFYFNDDNKFFGYIFEIEDNKYRFGYNGENYYDDNKLQVINLYKICLKKYLIFLGFDYRLKVGLVVYLDCGVFCENMYFNE